MIKTATIIVIKNHCIYLSFDIDFFFIPYPFVPYPFIALVGLFTFFITAENLAAFGLNIFQSSGPWEFLTGLFLTRISPEVLKPKLPADFTPYSSPTLVSFLNFLDSRVSNALVISFLLFLRYKFGFLDRLLLYFQNP